MRSSRSSNLWQLRRKLSGSWTKAWVSLLSKTCSLRCLTSSVSLWNEKISLSSSKRSIRTRMALLSMWNSKVSSIRTLKWHFKTSSVREKRSTSSMKSSITWWECWTRNHSHSVKFSTRSTPTKTDSSSATSSKTFLNDSDSLSLSSRSTRSCDRWTRISMDAFLTMN